MSAPIPAKDLITSGNTRARVVGTLLAIQNGRSLSSVLDPLLNNLHAGDKGFAHALLLTTLRQWHALARLMDSLADKPIDEIEVRTVIQVGLAQLLYLDVADHAAIHETVETAKEIGFARATGLINAILRKVAKNPTKFAKKCNKNHSLPNWLAKQLKADWTDEYNELTQGLRQSAPMFLRVNSTQSSAIDYQSQLSGADIETEMVTLTSALAVPNSEPFATTALRLSQSMAVGGLPNFEDGIVSVQDAHAQLAAPIIQQALADTLALHDNDNKNSDDKNDIQLLDACAAPGGKLAHWLELLNSDKADNALFHVKQSRLINMTAIDNDEGRNERIFDNLERLQLTPDAIGDAKVQDLNILCADATTWNADKSDKKNDTKFDAILLDAPCTATGVIRRHPDITLLRTESDVEQTVALQAAILDNLWSQVKSGGVLLYVTCSILKQENVKQMQDFVSRHTDARAIDFTDCNWGVAQEIGRQCLPIDNDGGDGFYFALLQKMAE